VQVEVAFEQGPDLGAGAAVGRGLGLEAGEVLGHRAQQRLLDDLTGARADARDRLDPAALRPGAQLVDGNVAGRVGGLAEGLLLVAPGLLALEQRGDTIQCGNGVHAPMVAGHQRRAFSSALSTTGNAPHAGTRPETSGRFWGCATPPATSSVIASVLG